MAEKKKNKHIPIVTKKSLAFLEQYINNASPTGFEWQGQRLWLDYVKPYVDEHYVDNYGTAVAVINPKAEYKVVIEAHADEISWFVNYITKEGLIYVIRNGGSDHQIAPSKRVNIHTDKGIVKAVFGWPAIHTRNGEKEEAPTLKNIFLDCGCTSQEEVEKLGIHVGCVITYEDEFMVLNDRYYVGRALDNRAGGFMIAEVARLLKENKKKLSFGLYIVNSVQEEIGLRGAEMIANRIKPNLAIVTDVTHDTQTPMINKITQGDGFLCSCRSNKSQQAINQNGRRSRYPLPTSGFFPLNRYRYGRFCIFEWWRSFCINFTTTSIHAYDCRNGSQRRCRQCDPTHL